MEYQHEQYMKRCIDLGKLAKEQGHPPVGSLIVKDEQVIAEAFEREEEIPQSIGHAELIAVVKAIKLLNTKDLDNCLLYTTKEPCFMCSYLIRQCKIKGVIFASPSGEIGGVGSNFPILSTHTIGKWSSPPFIIEGIMREECERRLK